MYWQITQCYWPNCIVNQVLSSYLFSHERKWIFSNYPFDYLHYGESYEQNSLFVGSETPCVSDWINIFRSRISFIIALFSFLDVRANFRTIVLNHLWITSRVARRCTRLKEKKKSIMKPTLHFLYVPADLKVYYQYILVYKKGEGGVNALIGNG